MNINLGQYSPREFNALPETVRESNVNKFQELFPEETDPSLIENKLSLITSLPNQPGHDLDRLKNFDELQGLAKLDEHKKFDIDLITDRKNQCWRFELSLNRQPLYASELQPIGDGHVLVAYEKAYLQNLLSKESPQAVPFIEDIRSIAYSLQNSSHEERLNSFQEVIKRLPFESVDVVTRSVLVDQENNKWSYRFAVGNLDLFESESIDIDNRTLFDRFQHLKLLQISRIRANLLGNFMAAERHRDDSVALVFNDCGLGPIANLAKSFETMARIFGIYNNPCRITFNESHFKLHMSDFALYERKFADSPPEKSLTERVQVAMSTLKIIWVDVTRAYQKARLIDARLCDGHDEQEISATFREAVENNGKPVSIQYYYPPTHGYFPTLCVVSDEGVKRTYAFNPSLSRRKTESAEYDMKIWEGIITASELPALYLRAQKFLNTYEMDALHQQMHETTFSSTSLGERLGAPTLAIN